MLTLLLGSAVQAADLDILLQQIKTDIAAKRLSTPAGNNALERIDAFRQAAPFDYRVLPLIYEWGDTYLQLANEAMDAGDVRRANGYLERVWQVASLTPGLEQAQARLDQLASGTQVATAPQPKKDSAAEAERQRRMAAAAEAERAKLERERQRRLEEAARQQQQEQQRALAERKQREEEERQRRLAAEKAAAEQRLAEQQAAQRAAAEQAKQAAAVAVVTETTKATAQPEQSAASDNTAEQTKLAEYPLDAAMIVDRNRDITDSLKPICQAILDNDASVVIHAAERADYRWLTVRFTLCLRRLDRTFRLRHSFAQVEEAAPHITLHPARSLPLVSQ
ncbi:hypothetical protein CHH28_19505 [Bacterioplanes sanyensis]|uniref:Uncharacterized protein n=2 Tax=Bacterioplanes sanyensis TaxID=1249553 RepID=A0A222FQP2_9GAMM|nr:hypothetical protein CHH28_19505 [Bacterioplanes sanyensis]